MNRRLPQRSMVTVPVIQFSEPSAYDGAVLDRPTSYVVLWFEDRRSGSMGITAASSIAVC